MTFSFEQEFGCPFRAFCAFRSSQFLSFDYERREVRENLSKRIYDFWL